MSHRKSLRSAVPIDRNVVPGPVRLWVEGPIGAVIGRTDVVGFDVHRPSSLRMLAQGPLIAAFTVCAQEVEEVVELDATVEVEIRGVGDDKPPNSSPTLFQRQAVAKASQEAQVPSSSKAKD